MTQYKDVSYSTEYQNIYNNRMILWREGDNGEMTMWIVKGGEIITLYTLANYSNNDYYIPLFGY